MSVTTKPRAKSQAKPDLKAAPEVEPQAEPKLEMPKVPQMTKTEAYALVKKSREGLREADNLIWKGTSDQLRAALLDTVAAATHLLDAVNHQGIKGVV